MINKILITTFFLFSSESFASSPQSKNHIEIAKALEEAKRKVNHEKLAKMNSEIHLHESKRSFTPKQNKAFEEEKAFWKMQKRLWEILNKYKG